MLEMKPMNILFISGLYPSQPGNPDERITRALHNIVKYWSREENVIVVRPVFIYLRELLLPWKKRKPLRCKIVSIDNVKIIVFPIFKIPRIAYYYSSLYRYLDKYFLTSGYKPDVVVAHYDKSLDIGYEYSRRRKVPLVVGLHITPDLEQEELGDFNRRCRHILQWASAIACRSQFIQRRILEWYPWSAGKTFVAFSGIESHIIREPSLGLERMKRWKSGLDGKISILTVSSLIEVKKIDVILEALAALPEENDWEYTVIGYGEERLRLEKLVDRLGIRERVTFRGKLPREQVIEIMAHSHIFVLVSILETFGLVYLEAMATGNIVIAGRGQGIDGIIRDHENGFLLPPAQPGPLTALLTDIILKQPIENLEKILLSAHQTIKQYTDENAAGNYLENLKEHCYPGVAHSFL